ncbi:YbaY family lipoprotein [Salinicola sp. LHM]|uniref:YbaY family lipoprotein n=1 Tax=Salinicola sp. LHM TaxID=3065298 RepID=UPI002ACF058B|nr:YbaY family lipoprotein [Salinicola sp. LHM]WQH32626.1 YbaY family lipoprotein [Salinicola sp. LHM]
MLSPTVPRLLRLVTILFALVVLAGCAGGPQFDTLAARVVSEKPITLPESATLEVQLKDISTGDVLASSRYERLGQLPIPITLQYATEAIDPDDLYRLSAQIRDGDRILYLNPEPVSVFADGDPAEPDIPVSTTGVETNR